MEGWNKGREREGRSPAPSVVVLAAAGVVVLAAAVAVVVPVLVVLALPRRLVLATAPANTQGKGGETARQPHDQQQHGKTIPACHLPLTTLRAHLWLWLGLGVGAGVGAGVGMRARTIWKEKP